MKSLASRICDRLRKGGRIYIFGNGGSAAQAQHFAAELMGSFKNRDRRPIAAIALTTDTSALTAIANDYGFVHVFERQVQALCTPLDVVIGLSTSGVSENIRRGLEARSEGALGIAFIGAELACPIAKAADVVDGYEFAHDTAHIQETHLSKLHDLAEEIELQMTTEPGVVEEVA